MGKRRKFIIFIIFLFVLAFSIGYWNSHQPNLETALYGEVIDSFNSEAVIIREERIYSSSYSGVVQLEVPEGEKVSYGQKVITVTNEEEDFAVYTNATGVISYGYDGLESDLDPTNLSNIQSDMLSEIKSDYNFLVKGKQVGEKDPLFRLVKNQKVYFAFVVKSEELTRYQIGEHVFIEEPNRESEIVQGQITGLNKSVDEQGIIIVKINAFKNEWLNRRKVKASLIKNIFRGIIISREAVFNSAQGRGILIQNQSGNYIFHPIIIEGGNEEKVVVTGLNLGDRIVKNPEVLNYGRGG
ncbi:MAG: HlyD family efflux transporter periplasmic adaptor subunit [Bacillota bacterium]